MEASFYQTFFTSSIRLYLAMAALLLLGPFLFGKGGAAFYPVFFVVASVVVFSQLLWTFRREPKPSGEYSSLGEKLASDTFPIVAPQVLLQLLSLHSVAAASRSLFWLWAVPLLLAALLVLWNIAFGLLIRRPLNAAGFVWGCLAVLALGYLGRRAAVEHYGVPFPGSFWEAPEYTVEAIANVMSYGKDGKRGRPFRARIAVKVGSTSDIYEDNEGREYYTRDRVGQILWIAIAGHKRPIIDQEGTLYIQSHNESVLVHDKYGKSYSIDDKLDFKKAPQF